MNTRIGTERHNHAVDGHNRDGVYSDAALRWLWAMGIRVRPMAPKSPWQNGHAERLIRLIRRQCLDHIVVFGETHLH